MNYDFKFVQKGFGPFEGHDVNASWIAVQELAALGIDESIDLFIYEIPVVYGSVKKIVPELWKKHSPLLMVHVGVSGLAADITLEQRAHNDGYTRKDVEGNTPGSKLCVDDSKDQMIISGLDMEKVCQQVNLLGQVPRTTVSHDPGRYLCDFSYFLSLHENKDCSAFIHVPPLNRPHCAADLARGLQACIQAMIKQLKI